MVKKKGMESDDQEINMTMVRITELTTGYQFDEAYTLAAELLDLLLKKGEVHE